MLLYPAGCRWPPSFLGRSERWPWTTVSDACVSYADTGINWQRLGPPRCDRRSIMPIAQPIRVSIYIGEYSLS